MLHAEQVRFLNSVIAERGPRAVLEVAPGPARLTAELSPVPLGVGAEFSPGMIATARARVESAGRTWNFIRADAFNLPLGAAAFDMAFTLRFVRHFAPMIAAALRRVRRVSPRGSPDRRCAECRGTRCRSRRSARGLRRALHAGVVAR